MKVLIDKYDGGSRIPGARLAPVKLYEKVRVYGRKTEKIFSVNIENIIKEEKNLSKLGELIEKEDIHLIIGGDHSITYYCAKSVPKKNSCLIIFDAHFDYFPNEEKSVTNWNFIEFLLQYFKKIVILGERNFEFSKRKHEKIIVFSSIDINLKLEEVKNQLEKIIENVDNIYISIDMDVINVSEFNSVSYPLIGGIQVAALLYMVNYVCSSNKVYLIDITEYNPLMGNDNSELFFQFFKIICQMLEGNQIE